MKQTPIMRQYGEIKAQYPEFLLFFRLGDFYEMFGDDAVMAADILQITLTQRRSKAGEEGIPMCGVPYHAAEGYIAKLIKDGKKIALCEQTETPEEAKKRGGYKAIVQRKVVRLYTGGTLTEDNFLAANESNWLVSIAEDAGKLGLAWLDIASGDFGVSTVTDQSLESELAGLNPAETLVTKKLAVKFSKTLNNYACTVNDKIFDSNNGVEAKFENSAQAQAAGAVMAYAKHTQIGKTPVAQAPKIQKFKAKLVLDSTTRRHLELTEANSFTEGKNRKLGSLLHSIDCTITAAGGRCLRAWLNSPLTCPTTINQRLDGVESFIKTPMAKINLRDNLKGMPDLARGLSRISLDRGSPRDLHMVRETLRKLPAISGSINDISAKIVVENSKILGKFKALNSELDIALKEEDLPLNSRDGNFIRTGYNTELDAARDMKSNGLKKLKELESTEQKSTEINGLKLKYNKVWGYFLEVTKAQARKIPEHYIHRQTTTGTQRFSTAELMTLERDFAAAEVNTLNLEQQIFAELVEKIKRKSADLLDLAFSLATLDVLAAGAELAEVKSYTRPVIDSTDTFEITGGRHPVVESTVDNFIANNCTLTNGQLWLITGPNMAGKSTFLRQNALLVIMAQMGFYVPASSAHIGIVDRIFTRIGAADDLSRGQSTFMVEMVETAEILNMATNKSLVILDEIGRGTATYDGLSIAWACVEYIANSIKCRSLFATHYHEITGLTQQFNNIKNYYVAVKEWQNNIVFLHEVKAGIAPRSYGVHVAKLAGLPSDVVKRAEEILQGLEKSSKGKKAANAADLPLFTAPANVEKTSPQPENSKIKNKLLEIDLDTLSPREAQNLLYDLKITAALGSSE